MITEERAREMSIRDAYHLIFEAGFSTAKKVTNVSGRGVGLDVVKANIQKLKGIVNVASEIGIGTTFSLKIPLTLAIIEGLLVKAHEETYSIPLSSVIEVIRIQSEEISTINGKTVLRHRDSVLPLAPLNDILIGKNVHELPQWLYVVVVGLAEQRLGIIVDELLGQKELVIKALGNYLKDVHGVAGSTILGDGKVIMILDIGQCMELFGSITNHISRTVRS